MAQNTKGVFVANSTTKQHSSQLQRNLAEAAKSLAARPLELRGPFVIRSSNSGNLVKGTKRG
jgi:hypothetical protein